MIGDVSASRLTELADQSASIQSILEKVLVLTLIIHSLSQGQHGNKLVLRETLLK